VAVYAVGYLRTQDSAGRHGTPGANAGPATGGYRDGLYAGDGSGLHGDIAVQVLVQGGRIASIAITRCGTQYPCSLMAPLQSEIVARQSAQVDVVSRATDSSIAYESAVAVALTKAR
jgi:uncharacterized protein with FMN-binding domain